MRDKILKGCESSSISPYPTPAASALSRSLSCAAERSRLPEDLHALCAHYRDQERSYQQSPLITANRFNKEKKLPPQRQL